MSENTIITLPETKAEGTRLHLGGLILKEGNNEENVL
jgi:hypothetical protein